MVYPFDPASGPRHPYFKEILCARTAERELSCPPQSGVRCIHTPPFTLFNMYFTYGPQKNSKIHKKFQKFIYILLMTPLKFSKTLCKISKSPFKIFLYFSGPPPKKKIYGSALVDRPCTCSYRTSTYQSHVHLATILSFNCWHVKNCQIPNSQQKNG